MAISDKTMNDSADTDNTASLQCAVCGESARFWDRIEGCAFTHCSHCGSIALNRRQMASIDGGLSVRTYDDTYWADEMKAARERCWGSSVARAVEAILLCQRPVERFIDLACGSGILLDSLSYHMPSSRDIFRGVELFPPEQHTTHPGFRRCGIEDLEEKFDCGVCIEVVEHLTPRMLDRFVAAIAKVSKPDSFFVFNTGLAPFVLSGNASYIDPLRRGHIVSYGWVAVQTFFERHGFVIHQLGQRDWSFGAEFKPTQTRPLDQRKWHPLTENFAILNDKITGMVPAILARESLRAYE
jgi:SAM-dependent methyltransferase